MARSVVTITALAMDGGVAEAAGATIVPAEGAVLQVGGNTRKLLIVVDNTSDANRVVTLVAPTNNPHAPRSALGNVAYTVAAESRALFVIESARFAQPNGDVFVNFAASTTGTIAAYRLPPGA